MTRFAPALAALCLLGTLSACSAKTDLGQVCKMTRPKSDTNPDTDIPADKVSNDKIDYLALGSAECDDLACLRTSGSQNPDNEGGKARGYCTAPCIDDTNCTPDYTGAPDQLHCEKLLLDEAFLADLKKNDPETYEKTFGSGASAKYCVKPRAAQQQ